MRRLYTEPEKLITTQQHIQGKAFKVKGISADEAFKMYSTHGLIPDAN